MNRKIMFAIIAASGAAGANATDYSEATSGDIDAYTSATDALGQPTRIPILLTSGANIFTGSVNSPSDPSDVIPFTVVGTLDSFSITFSNILIANPAYLNLSSLTGQQLYDGMFDGRSTTIGAANLNGAAGSYSFLIGGGTNVADYSLTLNVTAPVVVGPPTGAVPEPATWAMMVGGFGLVGGALRRRRPAIRFA